MRSSVAVIAACIFCAAAVGQAPPAKPKPGGAEGPGKSETQQPRKAGDTSRADAPDRAAQPKPADTGRAAGSKQAGAAKGKATPRKAIPAVDRLCALVLAADFDGERLEQVLSKLADASGANLIAQWEKLAAAGVGRDAPVTLHVRNVTFRELLRRLMEGVEKPDAKLAYRASRDMILLSTEEEFSGELITKIYYVQDIIANDTPTPTILVGRSIDIPTSVQPVVGPGAVAFQPIIQRYNSGQIVQFPYSSTRGEEGEYDPQREMAKLIDTILASVDPDSWDANGGRGTIRPFRNMIIVRNTPFVHQQLGGPLAE